MAKTLPSTGGASLIPGQGTKVLHVAKNLKKKKIVLGLETSRTWGCLV